MIYWGMLLPAKSTRGRPLVLSPAPLNASLEMGRSSVVFQTGRVTSSYCWLMVSIKSEFERWLVIFQAQANNVVPWKYWSLYDVNNLMELVSLTSEYQWWRHFQFHSSSALCVCSTSHFVCVCENARERESAHRYRRSLWLASGASYANGYKELFQQQGGGRTLSCQTESLR